MKKSTLPMGSAISLVVGFLVLLLLCPIYYCKIRYPPCSLEKYIRYYEPVNQSETFYATAAQQFISSAQAQAHSAVAVVREVSLRAFGREFKLSVSVRSKDHLMGTDARIEITNENTTRTIPATKIKQLLVLGRVVGEINSSVIGTSERGIFQGVIRLTTEIYHVENAARYFERPVPFESLMFRQSDVLGDWPERAGVPSSNKFVSNWRSVNGDGRFQDTDGISAPQRRKPKLKPLNLQGRTVCNLKVIADHTFFHNATDHSIVNVILEVILLLQEAQNIFSSTDFDGDGEPENVGFQVHAVQIILSRNTPNYRLYSEHLDIEEYLDKLADYDFDKFCLGVCISHRQFPSGALGVTYTASTDKRKAGGICQKRRRTKGQKRPKSYNSVVVTVVGSDGRLMPRFLSGLTVAHEMGHAFGSDHDPPESPNCSPRTGGAFVMSPFTLLGNETNNFVLSPCSRRQIEGVLREKAGCFVQRKSVCGNAIVEEGEECDCGTRDQCLLMDPCCAPKGGAGPDEECTVRVSQGYSCSPLGKTCCNHRCNFVPAYEAKDCTNGNDCYYPSKCSGLSADCPTLIPKPDGSECRGGLGQCKNGNCKDVICAKRKLEQCICKEKEWECQLCCKRKGGRCVPAVQFSIGLVNRPLERPLGEDCDDGHGYCTFGGHCVVIWNRRKEVEAMPGGRERPGSFKRGNKVVRVVTVLVICVLVVSAISLTLVLLYLFTPFGRIIHVWRY